MTRFHRRRFLQRTLAAAAWASARRAPAADLPDLKPLEAEIARRHDESVARLQKLDPPVVPWAPGAISDRDRAVVNEVRVLWPRPSLGTASASG